MFVYMCEYEPKKRSVQEKRKREKREQASGGSSSKRFAFLCV
jgi:hypothetical protein